jgi:hypothetical protein
VPQDFTQAAVWYRKAAEQNSPDAQLSLGMLYLSGNGLPQNYGEAYFWLNLAASRSQPTATANLAIGWRDKAASYLTPADLSRAQERARYWFESHPQAQDNRQ